MRLQSLRQNVDRIARCWYDRNVNDIDSIEEAREKMTIAPSISELDLRALWHPLTQHKPLAESPPPLMVRGEGCYLEDDQGRRYLDAMAGLWCVNVGYGRRELAETAAAQMVELAYLAPTMTHAPGAQLADKILELLGWRGRVYFSSSGSEANEVAFKVARQYHQQSGKAGGATRYKIISRHRAYHGNTLGAMSATGQAERKIGYGPMAPGFLHVPPPYPYRGHPKLSPAEHGIACAQAFEETIIYEGPETVAALLMEPIISGGGVLVPPDEYLPRVREICDEYGVLLIFDEVVSGFGRTGKLFGHDHWQVKPDIITMAKGLSSGYMPLAATAVQEHIFDAFLGEAGDLRHFRHINTFGGHPVSTAVGLRNLQIVEEEGLVENARRVGEYALAQLENLSTHPWVGEARGRGLLLGVELVADKETKQPLDDAEMLAILGRCKQAGVILGRNGNTVPGLCNILIVAPPLVATEAEIDLLIEALVFALGEK